MERVRELLRQEGLEGTAVEEVEVPDAERARQLQFPGSPSIRVNGRDVEPEARSATEFGLMCRMYRNGLPADELVRSAIREERDKEKA